MNTIKLYIFAILFLAYVYITYHLGFFHWHYALLLAETPINVGSMWTDLVKTGVYYFYILLVVPMIWSAGIVFICGSVSMLIDCIQTLTRQIRHMTTVKIQNNQ